MYKKICFLLITSIYSNLINGERLHEQIYSSIEGAMACFRRLNGTHETGCTSSNSGNVGVIQMIESVDDANWIVFNSTSGPYMAVVSTVEFQTIIPILIERPQHVAGVLLYEDKNEMPNFLSEESKCPNEFSSSTGSQCSSAKSEGMNWNPHGSGLLQMNIPFPIFLLPPDSSKVVKTIKECYERFNYDRDSHSGRALCSLQLNSFMFAAVNTDVCMRRSANSLIRPSRICDPLGDNNVYYSLFPRSTEAKTVNRSITMVTARIDSASLFDNIAPGGATAVVGLVTFLTAATSLSKMLPSSEAAKYQHNILWTLFHGEAFDYIGSQRIAYDISKGSWPPNAPIHPSQIKLHVEIGQVGGAFNITASPDWNWYAFVGNLQGDEFIQTMEKNLNKAMTLNKLETSNLPPSSFHSFQRILKNETGNIQQILLTDFKEKFTNKYYHSILDDDTNIGFIYHNISIDSKGTFIDTDALIASGSMSESDMQVKIARFATSLAKTLYKQVTDEDYIGEVQASSHLVDEMMNCYIKTQECRLLIASDFGEGGTDPEHLPSVPPYLYVGVSAWSATAALFTGHLLALLTGDHLSLNQTECGNAKDEDFSFYWMKGWNNTGVCVRTTMNFTKAISPAFTIPGYDFASGEYSSWTESVWHAMWARMFVSASGGGSILASVIGFITTFLAAAVTYWIQKHSQLIFPQPTPTSVAQINNDVTTGILRTVNC